MGSQVSGQIKELLADFNSEVKAGLVIARIDPETFEAKVRQARAELDVARANVHIQRAGIERAQKELANAAASLNSAKARTEKTRVTLVNAKRNLERRRALFQSGSVSESQIDDAQTAHDQTLAQMKGLISTVREFGLVPEDRVLDEHGYKAIYNRELMERVNERMALEQCGAGGGG